MKKIPKNKKFKKVYVTEYFVNDKLDEYVVHWDNEAFTNYAENLPWVMYPEKGTIRKSVLKEYSYTLIDKMQNRRHTERYILDFTSGEKNPTIYVATPKEIKKMEQTGLKDPNRGINNWLTIKYENFNPQLHHNI